MRKNVFELETEISKVDSLKCGHYVIEREMISTTPIWRCIYCDSEVKLKMKKNGVQKEVPVIPEKKR